VGVSATEFQPNTLLNREQAATALTRVLKRAYIPGWTFATDAQFKLNFTRLATFADDAQISDWAKESVYFMAANSIILGVGGNKFAPKATTTAEQAEGYASATREQAIIIGMRLVDNLKGKEVPYTQVEAPTEQPTTTTPPSGQIDANLVGKWYFNDFTYVDPFNGQLLGGFSYYYFNADGTYEFHDATADVFVVYGNYSVSDGKVNFTNAKRYQTDMLTYYNAGFGSPLGADKIKTFRFISDVPNFASTYNFGAENKTLNIAYIGNFNNVSQGDVISNLSEYSKN
jgi:hypothetical protein